MTEKPKKDKKPSLLNNDKRDEVRRKSLEKMKMIMKPDKYESQTLDGDDR